MYSKKQDQEEKMEKLELFQTNLEKMVAMETRLDRWAVILEKAEIDDLLYNYANPRRLIFLNILSGLARGFGWTIGTTIIVAILGYFLKNFISLPIIGEYIAKLLDIIDFHRNQ